MEPIKSTSYVIALYVFTLILCTPLNTANGQDSASVATEFAELSGNAAATGQQWFDLASKSRQADELGIASQALAKAAELAFPPVRIGFERTRLLIAQGNLDAAVAELNILLESGFTAVGFVTADPVINSLAGRADYDEFVKKMTVLAYPCQEDESFRAFDFWIGSWDVHVSSGAQAGTNIIEPIERGCALLERWTSASGGTGTSINYLDKSTNEWVQIWNAEGGGQINIRGGLTDEGMRMEGHIHYVGNGTTLPFRALWTPLPDGRVRQFFEQSNDGGETWVAWFEGFYTRTN